MEEKKSDVKNEKWHFNSFPKDSTNSSKTKLMCIYESKQSGKWPDPKAFWRRYSCLQKDCMYHSKKCDFCTIYFLKAKNQRLDIWKESSIQFHFPWFQKHRRTEIQELIQAQYSYTVLKKSNLNWDINILAQMKTNNFITFCQILLRKKPL